LKHFVCTYDKDVTESGVVLFINMCKFYNNSQGHS